MARRHHLDNFRPGAEVLSADGREVGNLHAIVIDPRDNGVTQIVVNAGPHFPEPGFGDPRLVEVPVDSVEDAGERAVRLRATLREFQQMPDYVERRFFPARTSEEAPPGNVWWNTGVAIAASLSGLLTGIAVPGETFRRAEFERHILEDTPVWREEPRRHIGDVERLLVDEETDEIRAFVVRRGGLFPHEVVLPAEYVTEIQDGIIRARISDEELERLEPFREELE